MVVEVVEVVEVVVACGGDDSATARNGKAGSREERHSQPDHGLSGDKRRQQVATAVGVLQQHSQPDSRLRSSKTQLQTHEQAVAKKQHSHSSKVKR